MSFRPRFVTYDKGFLCAFTREKRYLTCVNFPFLSSPHLRALTPLIYSHVTPYGTFRLDMNQRRSNKMRLLHHATCSATLPLVTRMFLLGQYGMNLIDSEHAHLKLPSGDPDAERRPRSGRSDAPFSRKMTCDPGGQDKQSSVIFAIGSTPCCRFEPLCFQFATAMGTNMLKFCPTVMAPTSTHLSVTGSSTEAGGLAFSTRLMLPVSLER